MRDYVGSAIVRFDTIYNALAAGPYLRADLSGMDAEDLPSVMVAVMNRGPATAGDIQQYLGEHGAHFDADQLDYTLEFFEGSDRERCLWRRKADGSYRPLIVAHDW